MITDDPGTPGNHNFEINVAGTTQYLRYGNAKIFQYNTPFIDVNYGVGDRIQLKWEGPWTIQRTVNANSDSRRGIITNQDIDTAGGLGTSNFGVKYRFYDNAKTSVSVSTYPQFTFSPIHSSVNRSLTNSGVFLLLPVEFLKEYKNWDIGGDLGYILANENSDTLFGGINISRQLTKRLQAMAEIHSTTQASNGQSEVVFNIGNRIILNEHLKLISSAGRGFIEHQPQHSKFFAYLGLQFLF